MSFASAAFHPAHLLRTDKRSKRPEPLAGTSGRRGPGRGRPLRRVAASQSLADGSDRRDRDGGCDRDLAGAAEELRSDRRTSSSTTPPRGRRLGRNHPARTGDDRDARHDHGPCSTKPRKRCPAKRPRPSKRSHPPSVDANANIIHISVSARSARSSRELADAVAQAFLAPARQRRSEPPRQAPWPRSTRKSKRFASSGATSPPSAAQLAALQTRAGQLESARASSATQLQLDQPADRARRAPARRGPCATR